MTMAATTRNSARRAPGDACMSDRLIVVGGVAAGAKAAATAHRRNPAANILVLQEGADVSYSSCGLPYHLAAREDIPRGKLIARTPEAFRADGIDVRTRHRVEGIDAKRAIVTIRDLNSARTYAESYDKLLIATGAQPSAFKAAVSPTGPPIVQLRTLADADHLTKCLTGIRKLVILGGGYIGLEMAETSRKLGLDVALVEMAPHVIPSFDETVARVVEAALRKHGVELFTGTRVVELDGGHVVLDSGARIQADMVLAATGVRPSTALATSAGVNLGTTGAIAVSPQMTTNVEHVYAAGDCVESRHVLTDRPVWMPLGDVANRQGRVAGINMAGGHAAFPGVLGTAIFRVFELAVARTGLGFAEASAAGFFPVCETIHAPSRARYIRESKTLQLHLNVDKHSGKLLGCQAVGEDGVDKTIDILATAIWGKLTAADLFDLDLAYAPPFSPVLAPVQAAGEVLNKAISAARRSVEASVSHDMA
jgi:CoA-dependent NAD(P)H sulfur oxidoreductase